MIERFNFYDIYGYFVPGAFVIGVAWFPFGFALGKWPSADLSNAVVFALAAYLAGLVVQSLAASVLPSGVPFTGKDSTGKLRTNNRYPSDFLLDADDEHLPDLVKKKIFEKVTTFINPSLELAGNSEQNTKQRKDDRNAAFNQARTLLRIWSDKSYAEQFQGLYSMTRALTLIAGIGSLYFLGWATPIPQWVNTAQVCRCLIYLTSVVLLIVTLPKVLEAPAGARKKKQGNLWLDRTMAIGIGILSFFLANCVGTQSGLSDHQRRLFLLCSAGLFWAGVRLWNSYRGFAIEFAQSVWSDFAIYQPAEPKH